MPLSLRKKLNLRDDISSEETENICNLYIDCFKHRAIYRPIRHVLQIRRIGIIYWHMVSKLLLAVQELYLQAEEDSGNSEILFGIKRSTTFK